MNLLPKHRLRRCGCLVGFIALSLAACRVVDSAEEQTADIQQTVSSVCERLQNATVRIRSGSDVSSGVLVSANGLILTVAHGLKRDAGITVTFSGETALVASRVAMDESADVALLSIDMSSFKDSDSRFIRISPDANGSLHEVVMAAGFPAREPDSRQVVVRIGEILGVDETLLKTSCVLTSGDSGGPLVNCRGELIGLNREIGSSVENNSHIRLSAIRRALNGAAPWESMRQQIDVSPEQIFNAKDLLPGTPVRKVATEALVNIRGMDQNRNAVVQIQGTLLDELHVASKLSEVVCCRTLECRFSDQSVTTAKLSASDQTHDLVILKLAKPHEQGAHIRERFADVRINNSLPGRIVFAATGFSGVSPAGIVSRSRHVEPSLAPRFGAAMRIDGERIYISEVSPNSSALIAGLKPGDELLFLDQTKPTSLADIGHVFESRQPGDWIALKIKRGQSEFETLARLQADPAQQFEKTEFLDGRAGDVSLRRSGFEVIQHDIALSPENCGSPLLDREGNIIAINIARRARESTLAIPIDIVVRFTNTAP